MIFTCWKEVDSAMYVGRRQSGQEQDAGGIQKIKAHGGANILRMRTAYKWAWHGTVLARM